VIKVKEYATARGLLLAACDLEIYGAKLAANDDFSMTVGEFYDGEPVAEDVFLEKLRAAKIANLVGERTVGLALAHGFIDESNVLLIGGVPHAQLLILG
jgi:hypothetical protein